jgi:hypothetical protein
MMSLKTDELGYGCSAELSSNWLDVIQAVMASRNLPATIHTQETSNSRRSKLDAYID